MKISPVSTMGFGARLTRNKGRSIIEYEYSINIAGVNNNTETSKKDKDYYIKKLNDTYRASIELDNFLRTDEIQKKIKELPGVDEVHEDIGNFDDERIHLYYNANSKKSEKVLEELDFNKASEITFLDIKAKNGNIDKEKIKNWIDVLYQYFSHDSLTMYKKH